MNVAYPPPEDRARLSGDSRLGPRRMTPEEESEASRQIEEIVQVARRKLERNTMHYRNGREAKNGDKIVQISGYGSGAQVGAVGVLYDAKPGNDHCNGNIALIQAPITSACLCDCLHVDDLAAILAEKGLDKRPAGK